MNTRTTAAALVPTHRRPVLRVVFLLALAMVCAGFIALGTWQLQRMGWKKDLIARVEARIHADPADMPGRDHWASVNAIRDEYRRVRAQGHFLDMPPTRVQAVTERGAGWWVLMPLETAQGDIVLVNRGFAASGLALAPPPEGMQTVSGLLRLTEPEGAFLRANAPTEQRWYSRDVAAIAAARALPVERTAPFFIDADLATSPGTAAGEPLGGLTVVRFRDSHLSYALTWFTLAGLSAFGAWLLLSAERGLRQHAPSRPSLRPADAGPTAPDE